MRHDSEVTLVGNAVRLPELRFTPGGDAVTNLAIAINNAKKNPQGEWIEGPPTYVEITCWRGLAEHVAESVMVGERLIVIGRLETELWEDKQGKERSTLRLQAEDIGHSLLWATVVATKASANGSAPAFPAARREQDQREEPRGSQRPAQSERGGGRRPEPRGGGRATATRQARPTRRDDFDEEPFAMDSFEGEDYYAPGTQRYS